jgi:hypothetical protein
MRLKANAVLLAGCGLLLLVGETLGFGCARKPTMKIIVPENFHGNVLLNCTSFGDATVITTDPNEVVQPMHDRMPVIIPERDYERWLQPGDPVRPTVDLLRPFDPDKMKAWKIGKEVGNVKNDTPELLTPDNVVEMQKPPFTDEEIAKLQDMDDAGEFDVLIERKLRRLERKEQKNEPKPEDPNLSFDF